MELYGPCLGNKDTRLKKKKSTEPSLYIGSRNKYWQETDMQMLLVETVVCLNSLKFATLCQTAGTVERGLNEKAQGNKQLENFNEFCSPLKNMKDCWRFTNEQRQDRKGNQVHVSGDKSSM